MPYLKGIDSRLSRVRSRSDSISVRYTTVSQERVISL